MDRKSKNYNLSLETEKRKRGIDLLQTWLEKLENPAKNNTKKVGNNDEQ